jgi:hypothetical protein
MSASQIIHCITNHSHCLKMISKRLITGAFALTWLFVSFSTDKLKMPRRQLLVPISHVIVDENGTLEVRRKPDIPPCRFFTDFRQTTMLKHDFDIKALHFHFDDCAENQLGNRLGEHYLNYLLANSARIPYRMTCGDAFNDNTNTTRDRSDTMANVDRDSVLRNIAVNLEEPGPVPLDPWGGQEWKPENVCGHCSRGGWWCKNGLNAMIQIIREDMIKLIQTEVGQSFEPQDAVLHLRLGDALKGTKDEHIGLLPHRAYVEILEEIELEQGLLESIGIVTQPFHKKLVRSFDASTVTLAKSRLVAFDLMEHLQAKFPHAKVEIHNGAEEIPLKSYARLIRAKKVAICGPSTFCTMPVLASQGTGYLFRGEKHSPW